ncbi:MAG: S66 family peptidase [Thermoplasmataceae archaeon]
MFRKVRRLRRGDKVAVVSPSRPVPSVFPAVAKKGIEALKTYFDLEPVVFPGAYAGIEESYRNPRIRSDDLNRAFASDEFSAIFSTIGGDESIRVLPFLDRNIISASPKAFIGYSDCSTYHTYLSNLGICSLHGPSIMSGFAQAGNFPDSFIEYIERILFHDSSGLEMSRFPWYSEGYPDWRVPENSSLVKEQKITEPWRWLQGDSMKGRIFAGNMEVLDWMRGTQYWPSPDFWNGTLLFLETSEEVPPPIAVERYLRLYGITGILQRINGLVFGRFRGYSHEMLESVEKSILSVVNIEWGLESLPVMLGFDMGHTDPQFPVPIGIEAEIRRNRDVIRILESFTVPV